MSVLSKHEKTDNGALTANPDAMNEWQPYIAYKKGDIVYRQIPLPEEWVIGFYICIKSMNEPGFPPDPPLNSVRREHWQKMRVI